MKRGLNISNIYAMNALAGETLPLAANKTSSSVTFANLSSKLNYDIIVANGGPNVAFISFGVGTATASLPGTNGTINAYPMLPGSIHTLQKNTDAVQINTCAGCCNAGETAQLYFTAIQGS